MVKKSKFSAWVMKALPMLPKVTPSQEKFLLKTATFHGRIFPGNECECLACGHKWTVDKTSDRMTCPECDTILSMSTRQKSTFSEEYYPQIVTTFHGVQVIRIFQVNRSCRRPRNGSLYTSSSYYEVANIWLDGAGGKVVLQRRIATWFYTRHYMKDTELKVRSRLPYSSYYDAELIIPDAVYPRIKVLPIYKRNGFGGRFHDILPIDFLENVRVHPFLETLAKTGRFNLLRYISNKNIFARDHDEEERSLRVVVRHKYEASDWDLWFRYYHLLADEGMDTLNPKYVCPEDLTAAYQSLFRKVENRRHREQAACERIRQREKLAKLNYKAVQAKYEAEKSKYFNLCFQDGDLTIQPLTSIQAFYEEGQAMHHCVFSSEYYAVKSSLILTARVNGKRVETVELSLSDYKVNQSRAVYNSKSSYHDRILDLVRKNINQVKQIKTA